MVALSCLRSAWVIADIRCFCGTRYDFMIDDDMKVSLIEINSSPVCACTAAVVSALLAPPRPAIPSTLLTRARRAPMFFLQATADHLRQPMAEQFFRLAFERWVLTKQRRHRIVRRCEQCALASAPTKLGTPERAGERL